MAAVFDPLFSLLILPAGIKTGSQTSQTFSGRRRGMHLIVDVSAAAAGQIITPRVRGLTAAGGYYDLLPGNAISDIGIKVYAIILGAVPVPGFVANDFIPSAWEFDMAHSGGGVWNYSVSANLL